MKYLVGYPKIETVQGVKKIYLHSHINRAKAYISSKYLIKNSIILIKVQAQYAVYNKVLSLSNYLHSATFGANFT